MSKKINRRGLLKTTAYATAANLALPNWFLEESLAQIAGDAQANQMLSRTMRAAWGYDKV